MKKLIQSLLALSIALSLCASTWAQSANDDLLTAVKNKDVEAARQAIDAGAEIDLQIESDKNQIIDDITMQLGENFAGMVAYKNITPLMAAAIYNDTPMVLMLLQKGAKAQKYATLTYGGGQEVSKNLRNASVYCVGKKATGVTALFLAIEKNNEEMVKYLLQSGKAMAGMPLTITSINKCIVGKKAAAIMKGSKPQNATNQLMLNPRKFATLTGKESIAEILKSYKKADWFKAGLPAE